MGLGSGIRDPGSEIRDPRSGIRDPGSEIRGPRSGIDPGSEIRDPENTYSGSRGQKGTGSRIHNTVFKTEDNVPADKLKKK
jgi:hypothetical protein